MFAPVRGVCATVCVRAQSNALTEIEEQTRRQNYAPSAALGVAAAVTGAEAGAAFLRFCAAFEFAFALFCCCCLLAVAGADAASVV